MHEKYLNLMEPYDWWNYTAPVYVTEQIREEIRKTGRSFDWQNIFWDGKIACAIFYRTRSATLEEDEEGFVTHVLPGSYEVSKTKWLKKISNLDKPKEEWK